jgi:hypothetical protein
LFDIPHRKKIAVTSAKGTICPTGNTAAPLLLSAVLLPVDVETCIPALPSIHPDLDRTDDTSRPHSPDSIASPRSNNRPGRVDLQQHIFSPQGSPFFMPNPFRRPVPAGSRLFVPALLLCLLSLTAAQAIGQEATPLTPFQKQMERFDLAVSAAGTIGTNVSGIEQRDAHNTTLVNGVVTPDPNLLAISPSSTVGELITLRYVARPLAGFEFNFGNSRSTQNFAFTPPLVPNKLQSAQTGVREMTLGYVAHTPKLFGVQPYLGVGGGTIRFKPTPNGGEGLPFQYRAAYYYNLGVEYTFPSSHFGARAGFRQLIYLAPDFQQNYLTITRRTVTSEPTFGFFLRF